jgi:putative flippase GtrA
MSSLLWKFWFDQRLMKFAKYGVVGGVAALIDLSLFWLGVEVLGWNWAVVAPIAFSVSTIAHYFLSIWMVFQRGARFGKLMEIAAIFAASIVGLVINQVALLVLLEVMGMGTVVSKLIADVAIIAWNYSVRAYYIFRPVKALQTNESVSATKKLYRENFDEPLKAKAFD